MVADLTTWPSWWPAIREVEALTGDPTAPDTVRFVFDTPAPLRPLVVGVEVTERHPPRQLVIAAREGPMAGTGVLRVLALDHGTDTSFDLEVSVRSLVLKPIEVLLARAARGGSSDRLRRAGDELAALAGGEPLDHDV